MFRGLVTLTCIVVASCAHRPPLAERVRGRASHDLHCPISGVLAYETGVGGWSAQGCGRGIAYVCARGTCARDGEIHEIAPALVTEDDTAWDVGPWMCTVHGAGTEDARASMRLLGRRVEQLASCGLRSLRARVATSGQITVIECDAADERCVRTLFEDAPTRAVGADHAFECVRP